jgi:hypothetical protein
MNKVTTYKNYRRLTNLLSTDEIILRLSHESDKAKCIAYEAELRRREVASE